MTFKLLVSPIFFLIVLVLPIIFSYITGGLLSGTLAELFFSLLMTRITIPRLFSILSSTASSSMRLSKVCGYIVISCADRAKKSLNKLARLKSSVTNSPQLLCNAQIPSLSLHHKRLLKNVYIFANLLFSITSRSSFSSKSCISIIHLSSAFRYDVSILKLPGLSLRLRQRQDFLLIARLTLRWCIILFLWDAWDAGQHYTGTYWFKVSVTKSRKAVQIELDVKLTVTILSQSICDR